MKASATHPLPALPDGAPGVPKGTRYKEQYGVIIVVPTPEAQKAVFETLLEQGFKPRVVVT